MAPPKRAKPAEVPHEKRPREKPSVLPAPEIFGGEPLRVLLFQQWAEHLGVRSDIREIADEAVEGGWEIVERHDFPRRQTYYGKHYDRLRRPYAKAAADLKVITEACERWAKNLSLLSMDDLKGIKARRPKLFEQLNFILVETPEDEAGLLTAYAKIYGFFKGLEGALSQDPKPKVIRKTRKAVKEVVDAPFDEGGVEVARRASELFEEFIDETDPILASLDGEASLQGLDKGKKKKLLERLIDGPDTFKICGEDEIGRLRTFAFKLFGKIEQENGPFCQVLKPYLEGYMNSLK